MRHVNEIKQAWMDAVHENWNKSKKQKRHGMYVYIYIIDEMYAPEWMHLDVRVVNQNRAWKGHGIIFWIFISKCFVCNWISWIHWKFNYYLIFELLMCLSRSVKNSYRYFARFDFLIQKWGRVTFPGIECVREEMMNTKWYIAYQGRKVGVCQGG